MNLKGHPNHRVFHHPITRCIAFAQREVDLEVADGKYGCLLCVTHSLSRIANMMCTASRRSGSEVGNCPSTCPSPHCTDRQRRSEEHTSELQSRGHLVCRLLLEKKKKK